MHCRECGNLLRWVDPKNIDFKEAENNPTTTYACMHAMGLMIDFSKMSDEELLKWYLER